MAGKKLITILGITGTQTRKEIEVVQGDHDDVASLKTAFAGANAIFAVTDWAANYLRVSNDKALQEKAATMGKSVGEYAGDLEMTQGINIANAASDPDVLSTLQIFVFSTLPPTKKISGGKCQHAYEFDSKAAVECYIREQLPGLRDRLSTVTMGIYQETWKDIPAFRPHRQQDGTFAYVRLKCPGLHQENPEVVASRDTGAFVEALVLRYPPGTDVLGASEIITKPDYAARWGRTMGVKVTVRDVSEEEYRRYVPEELQDTIIDLLKFFAEYGYTGGNPKVKTPADLGIETTPLEEFFRGEDWSAVLEGDM